MTSTPPRAAPPGVRLRAVTWNVRSLRDDERALTAGVRLLAPDLLLVQEAPRFPGGGRRLRRFARRCGLRVVVDGWATRGPALLVAPRVGVERAYAWALPRTRGQYARGIAAADVRLGGASLLAASTHLGLTAAERESHAGELVHLLARSPNRRRLLGADLNEPPDGPVWRRLAEAGLRDSWSIAPTGGGVTFPARSPRRRIDAVLITEGVTVNRCGTPDLDPTLLAAATDHRPVVADVEIR